MSDEETLRCAACGRIAFPEGIGVLECLLCAGRMHPGCAAAHVRSHVERGEAPPPFRRGTMGAYGVIRWKDPS